jgi:hypothetical protein
MSITDPSYDIKRLMHRFVTRNNKQLYLSTIFADHCAGSENLQIEGAECEYCEEGLLVYEGEYNWPYNGRINVQRIAATLGLSIDVHRQFQLSTDGDMFDRGCSFSVAPDGRITSWRWTYYDPHLDHLIEKTEDDSYSIPAYPDLNTTY